MKIPALLLLCTKLTTQKYVATCLDTQGHVIRNWYEGKVTCLRKAKDFEFLINSVIDEYEEFPEIVDYLKSIKIELNDWKETVGRKRKGGKRSMYSKPVGRKEKRRIELNLSKVRKPNGK